jgi:hypothetical protein
VGKDYLASILVKEHNAVRLSFSDEVRNLAQVMFPWFNAYMPDEQKDKVYEHPNNTTGATGRDIILVAGKVREVDSKYFVRAFIKNQMPAVIANPERLYVITDFRTEDEYEELLKPLDVPIIKVERKSGLAPHPFEEYIRGFNDFHATFNNCLDGTGPFLDFFKHFAEQKGVTY